LGLDFSPISEDPYLEYGYFPSEGVWFPMAKAYPVNLEAIPSAPGIGDLCLFALPVETFRALTNEAAARGLTLAQFIQVALDAVMTGPRGPTLLTESNPHG
jgi:hypothetical protein